MVLLLPFGEGGIPVLPPPPPPTTPSTVYDASVEEEVKHALKAYYKQKDISKNEYRSILRRAVLWVCYCWPDHQHMLVLT